MNAKQGIKCGEVVIRSGGVMAVLVSGGRLTDGSIKRLQAWKDSPKEDAVLILEAEPFFEDGVAADVKIEIVNLQPAKDQPVAFGSDLPGGSTALDFDGEIEAIDTLARLRGEIEGSDD